MTDTLLFPIIYIHSFLCLSLSLVKHFITYILAFYILLSATLPCSFFDQCEEEVSTETTNTPHTKNDCSGCSPFSVCYAATGFTLHALTTSTAPFLVCLMLTYGEYKYPFKAGYASNCFKPPRTA